MNDLIRREDALKAIFKDIEVCQKVSDNTKEKERLFTIGHITGLYRARTRIRELPTADRPTGKWVESLERNDMMYWYSYGGYCTNCGEYSEYLTRYCGDCGAVMYALNDHGEVIGGEKI